ncbi:MAG: bifunctional hydroxymethylpyrimidine kinase/phosphomethylpyrimidine kinase, partial [Thermodesulfobacteriota bacterium]
MNKIFTALTIAGSDPSGGAGIQADLKTFSSFGVYGQSIITSLTAQNIHEVKSIQNLPQKFIGEQFDSISEDLGFNAVKIGMLSSRNIVRTVVDKIIEYKIKNIVLDPVITSTTGARLLNVNAVRLLKEELIPMCRIITPNIPEAEELTGISINDTTALKQALVDLKKLGCRYVLIKGGHRRDTVNSDDILYDGRKFK